MTPEEINPYRSSAAAPLPVPTSPIRANLARGIACALPAAVVGFAIPYAWFSMLTLVRHYAFEYPQVDVDADFRDMPMDLLWAGIVCSDVFGLAAVLNYSPAVRIGIVRALMFVGFSALAAIFLMVVAAAFGVDLFAQSYTSDPWAWLRLLIVCGIPCIYTIVHTATLFARPPSNQPIATPNFP